jgi:hypothetical protein
MFTENTIKNLKWRNELNRILNKPDAQDQERLFFVCFLRDKLGWDENKVIRHIMYYAKWSDLNEEITTRQVNIIFERKESGLLRSGFKTSIETYERETQHKERFSKIETSPYGDMQTNFFPSSEFRVSSIEEEVRPIEEIKVLAKINDGNRWYKISEKQGQYGNFFSIDSGKLIEVRLDDGKTALGNGSADKFFSLPKEPKTLRELINGLEKLIPDVKKK